MLSIGIPLFGKKKKCGLRPPSFQPSSYLDPKVGGVPIIPLPFEASFNEKINLQCQTCQKSLFLLFQACTPFDREGIDRILFVFECNNFECTRSSESIVAFAAYLRVPKTPVPHVTTSLHTGPKKDAPIKKEAKLFNPFVIENVVTNCPAQDKLTIKEDDELVFISKPFPLPRKFTAYPIEFEERDVFEMDDIANSDSESDTQGDDLENLAQNLSLTKEIFGNHLHEDSETLGFENESFERILPPNLDENFYNFEKTILKEPWQVIRYSWNGFPLLAQSPVNADFRCHSCSSPLVFECQLMPALLHLLQTEKEASIGLNSDSTINENSKGMEWATILIYSCSSDCGASKLQSNPDRQDAQDAQDEHCIIFCNAIIQHEPNS